MNNIIRYLKRPIEATQMLHRHRRTMNYLLKKGRFKNAYNFAFTTYFIRGEDCGKGCLDALWKFMPWLVPVVWDAEIELTTKCPLSCRHCERQYWPDPEYKNQNTSFADFKKLVDSLPKLKWINMTGEGSGLMNPDFMKMVRYAKSKDLYVDFSHDFFTMSDSVAREIISLGVERLYISLDGATKQTYESIRVGSDFDKVVKNIRRFVHLKKEMKSPLPEICVRMAFFNDNVHEVELMPDLFASFGDRADLGDEPSLNIVALLEFPETKDMVCEVSQEVVDRTNVRAKQLGVTLYWSHVTHEEQSKPPADYCVFWSEPYISIEQDVLPDCAVMMSNKRDFLHQHSLGNLKDMTLPELWQTPKYKKFRGMITNPKGQIPSICEGCRVFNTKDRVDKYGVWDMSKE